jgi:hypothetical protein
MEQISRVLLVGGSSRIPLVGLLVRELTGRPVAVDAHPKLAIATGAALVGAAALTEGAADATPLSSPVEAPGAPAADAAGSSPSAARLAAAAAGGFAATAGVAAVSGVGTSAASAAAPSLTAAAGLAGPAGVGIAAGPTGASLAAGPSGASLAAGPAGTSIAAGPTGTAGLTGTAGPTGTAGAHAATAVRTAAKARHFSKPMMIASAVGVAAAAGAIAVVTTGGAKPQAAPSSPAASHSTTSPATGTTVPATTASPGSSAPSASTGAPSAPTVAPGVAARGLTGLATLVAGIRTDNSGKGVPGPATAVSLGAPGAIAVGPDGSVYLLDTTASRLLKVSGGAVTVAYSGAGTLGGLAVSPTGTLVLLTGKGLVQIAGDGTSKVLATLPQLGDGVSPGTQTPLAFDGAGNLYIGNSNRYAVLRRSTSGAMSRVAGNGQFGITPGAGDGAAATAAPMSAMTALLVDADGNLLIGQANGALRKVAADGTLSTIAGIGAIRLADASGGQFAPDGTKAIDLKLAQVSSLVIDANNRLYIGDSQSSAVVRVEPDGTVTLIAGDQSGTAEPTVAGQPANQTRFADADGLAFDRTGGLLVVDNTVLLRIDGAATA